MLNHATMHSIWHQKGKWILIPKSSYHQSHLCVWGHGNWSPSSFGRYVNPVANSSFGIRKWLCKLWTQQQSLKKWLYLCYIIYVPRDTWRCHHRITIRSKPGRANSNLPPSWNRINWSGKEAIALSPSSEDLKYCVVQSNWIWHLSLDLLKS